MTAVRVVTLTCDKPGCRERYIGGAGAHVRAVRAEASKLGGWVTGTGPLDADRCRWHA